jgi:hypothetical protein
MSRQGWARRWVIPGPAEEPSLTVVALPDFTADDVLPPGDYELTLEALRASRLVQPDLRNRYWDHGWRRQLVDNLDVLISQLWQVGVTDIFIDGSFVENKDHPNDIDGYFPCDIRRLASGDLERELNLLDPHKVWTWDPKQRTAAPGFTKLQLPMWHRYRVELYPHVRLPSGIPHEHGNDQEFPAAFRKSRRDHKPKGIVKIIKGS